MVKINKKKCIGCGACASTCPQVFDMNDNGKAEVKAGADLKKNAKCISEAIKNCPVEAISK